jgi:hypothetical protein
METGIKSVKLSVGYSAKNSKDFNSQSFSISIEGEVNLASTQELERISHELYSRCRHIVSQEQNALPIGTPVTNDKQPSSANQPAKVPPMNTNTRQYPAINETVSPKQIKYIYSIARSKGYNSKAVNDTVFEQYKSDVEHLSRSQASLVINQLKLAA